MLMTGNIVDQVINKYGLVAEPASPLTDSSHQPSSHPGAIVESSSLLQTDLDEFDVQPTNQTGGIFSEGRGYTGTQAATAVALAAGICQLAMGVMRLGAFSVLLSDVLVSAFTTGAAVHVLTAQLKSIFGLSVPKETRFPRLLRVLRKKDNSPFLFSFSSNAFLLSSDV
jgi:MFS superfamily sulfate permease-like transporter